MPSWLRTKSITKHSLTCVFVCVCVCVCVFGFVCVCVYARATCSARARKRFLRMCVPIYVCTHINMCAHTYTCVHTHTHVCVRACWSGCVRVYVCVFVCWLYHTHLPNSTWLLKHWGFRRLSLGLTCIENSPLHSPAEMSVKSTRRMMSDESAVFYVLFFLPL